MIGAAAILATGLSVLAPTLTDVFRTLGLPRRALVQNSLIETPRELGSVALAGRETRLDLRLDFCPSSSNDYQNLFQTDDVNEGVRAELAGENLAIVYRSLAQPDLPRALVLSTELDVGRCHTLIVSAADGQSLTASLDGGDVASALEPIVPLRNMRIGIGFDDTRRFQGRLEKVEVSLQPLRDRRVAQMLVRAVFWALCGMVAAGILWNLRFAWLDIRPKDVERVNIAPAPMVLMACSILMAAIGAAYHVVWTFADAAAATVHADILPGVMRTAPYFKAELIGFVLLSGLPVLFALVMFHRKALSAWALRGTLPKWMPLAWAVITVAVIPFSTMAFSRASFLTAFVLAAFARITECSTFIRGVSIANSLRRRRRQSPTRASSSPALRDSHNLILTALLVASLALAAGVANKITKAWYPIQLPPDYYELPVSVATLSGDALVSTSRLLTCLNEGGGIESAPCPLQGMSEKDLERSAQSIYNWQVETGRLMFHHAYMMMPIKALLTYGTDTKVPFLYGLGNSMFAVLMAGGHTTFSAYFEAIPRTVLCALIIIAILSSFAARDEMLAPMAFLAGLWIYFTIDFVAVYLAASFNPARFIGVAAQAASVFASFRPKHRAWLLLPAALAFSAVWNVEFALIGSIAQFLALASPTLMMSRRKRYLCALAMLGLVLAAQRLSFAPTDLIQTVQLGFFNYVSPALDREGILSLYIWLIVGISTLVGLSMMFQAGERDARLALIPVLALLHVKYVFNPADPHLLLVWIFVIPISFVYIPWRALDRLPRSRTFLSAVLLACIAGGAWQAGATFEERSRSFKQTINAHLVLQSWSRLGETFEIAQPEDDIVERVSSLRSRRAPADKIFILSPFDHLLAIYAPPADYCGHFEPLSNIVLKSHAAKIDACLAGSPNSVVVYDSALDLECPTESRQTQRLDTRCTRFKMKQHLRDLFESIKPHLMKVAQDGALTYFRYEARAPADGR